LFFISDTLRIQNFDIRSWKASICRVTGALAAWLPFDLESASRVRLCSSAMQRGKPQLLILISAFCLVSAASASLSPIRRAGSDVSSGPDTFRHDFPLGSVTLAPDSPAARAADLNRHFLLMIDPDSLLWTFRKNAGLAHDQGSPYWRSWEDPGVEVFMHANESSCATVSFCQYPSAGTCL